MSHSKPLPARRLALVAVTVAFALKPHPTAAAWEAGRFDEIRDATLTVRLAPDLSVLTPGERAAVDELLAVGEIFQRLYEDTRHPEAARVRASLDGDGAATGELTVLGVAPSRLEDARFLFRLFQGPVATTLDNRREPFVDVRTEAPGKAFYPDGIEAAEVERFLTASRDQAHSEEILGERTEVRRATAGDLARDLDALSRYPALDLLHPGLGARLRALAASPDPSALYAVPYAVARADEVIAAQRHLFRAADHVEGDDPELARYLRNRGRDLLSNDYESGDASWVTGRFGRLNAQIGAYETYDDNLFGVKASWGLSLLLRDEAATAELRRGLGGLQQVEDALPYQPPGGAHKTVRADVPVGVYDVIADFGQARGTNTATILPNDALFSRRYGRTILMRRNVITHPDLAALADRRWRAAVTPAHADESTPEGSLQRTLWHEIGHYLGPDRSRDGRSLDQALKSHADALEEMKSDLVSLFALHRFHEAGMVTAERLREVQASGILRTLQIQRPRPDQPYQTMQLAQLNWFLEHGLLAADPEQRLEIRYEDYDAVVRELLAAVLALQLDGDAAAAGAFFERWTSWSEEVHESLARRLREAQGPRFRLVRYAVLGE